MTTTTTRIGPCKGKPHSRIWIEGQRLLTAGFSVGVHYDRIVYTDSIRLTRSATGKYIVSGKGPKPIIDLIGTVIETVFPAASGHTHVLVTFETGDILLSAVPETPPAN